MTITVTWPEPKLYEETVCKFIEQGMDQQQAEDAVVADAVSIARAIRKRPTYTRGGSLLPDPTDPMHQYELCLIPGRDGEVVAHLVLDGVCQGVFGVDSDVEVELTDIVVERVQ